ncbi:hypothetical protein [Streptomyces inhibens]|uniref:hypothetical protein n=1 Tax=Streptomyces inhibens TaxID=2293571 RepID=UPI001EE71908|nr:hypothetical protein [Streptomyces inhibens]UKY48019.1 hypothetical protein KI385_03800 [Streptomyces inhibens]
MGRRQRQPDPLEGQDLPGRLRSDAPTEVTMGRRGELNVFACLADPAHLHRRSMR